MEDPEHYGNIHKIMAIDSVATLLDWCDLLYLVSERNMDQRQRDVEFAESALTPPPGLVAVRSGYQVGRWEEVAKDWSIEDRSAMHAFLTSERLANYLQQNLDAARWQQERYRTSDNFIAKALATWYRAGVHPAQEPGWVDGTSSLWDEFDMLAALRQVVQFMARHPDLSQLHQTAFDRATGVWQMLLVEYPMLRESLSPDVHARAVASDWRRRRIFAAIPTDKRQWIQDQMIIECMNLWNHAFDILEIHCPEAFRIVALVSLTSATHQPDED
jgi:hypothetical protein